MTQRLPPAASVARLQFDAPGEKYADWSAADFDVKAWVNRELAAAKDDFGAPGAKGDANRDGSLSVVAQQELDGFATTVLEEEGLRDASRIADVGGQTGGKLSSEQLASGLVTRLQSMAAEISGNIDKVCEDSLKNVPRVLYDLDAVRTEAARIKGILKRAQQTFDSAAYAGSGLQKSQSQAAINATLGSENAAALANGAPVSPTSANPLQSQSAFSSLLALDTVLSRMLQSLAALQETEHWTTLGTEMASIFATGDLDRAATRLLEAQRSLSLLEQTAGYEERKQLLTDLMNKLEAEILPKLVEAIEKKDIEATKRMKGVLARMGRAGELFGRYYAGARKMALVEMWKAWSTSPGKPELDAFLTEFYDSALSMLTKELAWANGLFGDVIGAMQDLLGQVFTSLTPGCDVRLSEFMSAKGAGGFPTLVHIFSTACAFAQAVESLLSGFSESWSLPLLEPFTTYQATYGNMEQRYLLSLLDDPNREYAIGLKLPSFTRDVSSAMESYAETVQIVADSVVPSSFSSAEGAVLRCEQLTYGFAIPALLDALDAYFQRVVRDGIGSVLTGVRKASGLETPAAGGARQKLSMADGGEWEIFQLGLKILAVCANLDKRFADFETGVLRPALKNAANIMEIREDVDDDGVESDSEPTSPNVAKAVQALPARGAPKSPEDGSAAPQSALSILRRSPLNSNELRTLLLAPPTPLLKPPLEQLTRSAHRLVFDASFLPIQNEFSGFAGLAWNVSESSPVAGAGQRRYGMMEMPQFSLTPSAYITRIGEHLLTLPQQMELYQDDEGLCYRADLLPHLELARPAEVAGQEPGQEADGEEDELMSLPAAALYLTALSLGTQVLFVQSAVALSALSDKGARQLSADAGYLANVVSALDVEVLPTFRAIEDMCGCSSHEVAGKLEAALAQGCGKEEEDVRRRIASLRGVGQQSGR